jgi:NDP-sugar pyrophosphorylase family protein
MRAMILAAGLGTRMRPLSDFRAKPALPVVGRPVISLLLELLARQGVRKVLINLHHRPESIRDAIAEDHPEDLEITWSEEPQPLGTGGGIRCAADFLRAEPDCVVMAGDMLLDMDLTMLLECHRASGRDATLVLRDDRRGADFGTIGVDERGGVTRIGRRPLTPAPNGSSREEVQRGLFTSVRFFRREALDTWPSEPARSFEDLRDWLAPGAESGHIRLGAEIVAPDASVWEPVGTPSEYLNVNLHPPDLPSLGGDAERWRGDVEPVIWRAGRVVSRSAEVPRDVQLDRVVVWDGERLPRGFSGRDGVYAGGGFHSSNASPAGRTS